MSKAVLFITMIRVLHHYSKKAVAGVGVRRRLPERWAVIRKPGATVAACREQLADFFRRLFRPACAIAETVLSKEHRLVGALASLSEQSGSSAERTTT